MLLRSSCQQMTLVALHRSVLLLLCLLASIACQADGAPPRKGKVFGPCVGMDCLHGVLMHGDAKSGETHAIEDAEKHRDDLEQGKDKKPIQMNQDEYLHGVMMHGDAKMGGTHTHEKAPTAEKLPEKSGPMDQEALMHGIMHGDSDPAHQHRHEKADEKALKASAVSSDHGVPGVEPRPRDEADLEAGLLGRWWRLLKQLVFGDRSANPADKVHKADYNTLRDLAAVGNTKSVSELEKASGHSHKDTERVHNERDRREHAGKVHTEH